MLETTRGRGWEADGRRLVPVSRALFLRAPGVVGGFLWSRPFGVEIEEAGKRRLLRIPDRTREIQWTLLAAGLAVGLLARRRRRRRLARAFLGR